MANEAIVSSGIYYFDAENVTTSHLAFRRAVSSLELDYEQYDEVGLKVVWGLDGYVHTPFFCHTMKENAAGRPVLINNVEP
jgi:hypothetical protein